MRNVPQVGSMVRVRTLNSMGPRMTPPRPAFNEYEGKVLAPYKWLKAGQFCMSGDAKWPIRVITLAFTESITVASVTTEKTATVEKVSANKYNTRQVGKKWHCECPGFGFRRTCKHVTAMKEMA
jgi:hypothetical protein